MNIKYLEEPWWLFHEPNLDDDEATTEEPIIHYYIPFVYSYVYK